MIFDTTVTLTERQVQKSLKNSASVWDENIWMNFCVFTTNTSSSFNYTYTWSSDVAKSWTLLNPSSIALYYSFSV